MLADGAFAADAPPFDPFANGTTEDGSHAGERLASVPWRIGSLKVDRPACAVAPAGVCMEILRLIRSAHPKSFVRRAVAPRELVQEPPAPGRLHHRVMNGGELIGRKRHDKASRKKTSDYCARPLSKYRLEVAATNGEVAGSPSP